jgi:AraC-like DNA-binding protein
MLDNLCRLVAITAGAAAPRAVEGGREAVRAARLERARRHVERHLAEPGLTVAGVAAAAGVSVRQLHLLFEPTGESFARYLQRRRLEETRAALADPAGAGRTVAEIAFAWGFADLTTFYRAFRRAYGAAPGELRPARRLRPPPGSP